MNNHQVYIILTHTKVPKHPTQMAGRKTTDADWEIKESIRLATYLKTKDYQMATLIADFTNQKIISSSTNIKDYDTFYNQLVINYPDKLKQLESAFKIYGTSESDIVDVESSTVVTDTVGTTNI